MLVAYSIIERTLIPGYAFACFPIAVSRLGDGFDLVKSGMFILEAVFWREASYLLPREVVFMRNGGGLIKTTWIKTTSEAQNVRHHREI